jgi:AcrR family transcriptional regulator
MESNVEKVSKARGRPLSFDRDKALEDAMHVFWERGYEAASISELTAAMGITPPSLYTAFGDKEHLFLERSSVTRAARAAAPTRRWPRSRPPSVRSSACSKRRPRAHPPLPPGRLHGGDGSDQLLGGVGPHPGRARQAPRGG